MANKQSSVKLTKSDLEFSLIATLLKKLAVEVHIPPESSQKGRIELTYKIEISESEDGSSAVAHLMVTGRGLANDNYEKEEVSFTIDAAIDGLYKLSRRPKEGELAGLEASFANPVIPLLSDMIETLLAKCGYNGVSLSKSFPAVLHPKKQKT